MPDEDEQQHDLHDLPNDEPTDATADDRATDHPDDGLSPGLVSENDGPDERDVEEPDPFDAMPERRPLSIAARNLTTLGQLSVHYPARTVDFLLDGDAALRLLTMFAQRREGGLADVLDPDTSDATAGWVVLDLGEPLAMSWMPGLPSKRPRTAIDPAVSVA
jgi:hypothetical protein